MPFPKPPAVLSKTLGRAAYAAVLAFLPLCAMAVALGEVSVRSALGQKLEADIEISSLSANEAELLAVRLAPADMFAEAGLDYTPVMRSIRLSLEKRGERQLIHLSSDLPVNDPFLIVMIEVNANGNRTMRQYSLLLDPPVVSDEARVARIDPPVIAPESSERSSLAPAASAAASADTRTIRVRPGDTLASIVQRLPPQSASLEQLLIAFLRANPQAFSGNNIHRIKAGSVLRLPDEAGVRSLSPAYARQQVKLQTEDFQRYRSALATVAPAAAPPAPDNPRANRSSSGVVGVEQREDRQLPATRDQLRLSAPALPATPATPPDAQATAQQAEVEKIAREKALAEAQARIAELERNIGDMQQQLALNNRTQAEVPTKPAVPGPAEIPATPAQTGARAAAAGAAAGAATPAATDPAEPAGFAARVAGALDTVRADPLPMLGAAGALAAGGLLLLLRSRMLRRRSPAERIEPNATAQALYGEAGGRNIDTSNSVFHSNFVPSVSQLESNEVDAVAEADVYIAYGRDEQAEEILLDALKQHPDRHALRVKLLEIHAARKDARKFGVLAAELRVLTHGHGPEWQQAAQMGRLLDSGNLLYAEPVDTAPADILAADTAPSPPAAAASPVDDFGIKLEGLLDAARKDGGAAGLALVPQSPASIAPEPERRDAAAPVITDFGLSGLGGAQPAAEGELITLKTKIDLALACQEIGDKDGARELLTEVAGTRHVELAQRAQSLLQQLA